MYRCQAQLTRSSVMNHQIRRSNLEYTTATFYGISNCQPGLKNISFGNFLIKQVVQELQMEYPSIKTFVTLSPFRVFINGLVL